MANLKEIRIRVSSVRSTRQITSAMKMVSAAKLRKAQDAILQMRPYAKKLHDIINKLDISEHLFKDIIYFQEKEIKKVLLVVITSNRGLCGAFNANAIKMAMQIADEKYKLQNGNGNVDIICIGKRGNDYLKSRKYKVIKSYLDLFDKMSIENAYPIIESIIKDYTEGKYDKVELIFNQFKNAAVQTLIEKQFLPILHEEKIEDRFEDTVEYILEPTKEYIINELIPKSLRVEFYKALLDSHASEHGARMTAMHKATDNATELIKELQLEYNKARQASITKEILEIVAGAEALK
jgi:F-type H+-transporting ATPase subunit gamma